MRYINLTASSDIRPRERLRVTWSRSLWGDMTKPLNAERAALELETNAHTTAGRIPSTGLGYKAEGPTITASADAFTCDIITDPRIPSSGYKASAAVTALDNIGEKVTVTRLERVTASGSHAENERLRTAANNGSMNAAGVTGIVEAGQEVGRELLDFTGDTVKLVAVAAVVVAALIYLPKPRRSSSSSSSSGGAPRAPGGKFTKGAGAKGAPRGPGGKFVKGAGAK